MMAEKWNVSDPGVALRPAGSPLPALERRRRLAAPAFGTVFTEHMVTARWSEQQGWNQAELTPFGPLEVSPATVGLHYGQSVFEGLKAYRRSGDRAAIFRPRDHARRLNDSARRLMMPELPQELFVAAAEALVRQDMDWIPDGEDLGLYLRPVVFASEQNLELRPAREYRFFLIAFPTENFFGGEPRPVAVSVSETYVRAAAGGTGAAKFGGNYAGAYAAQVQAAADGADQVVWLDSVERRWVEELGGMNLFFVHGSGAAARLTTPPLTGTILPGVTRDTLLRLADDLGIAAEEARISLDEWREGCWSGEISETFACGTAARITAVGEVRCSSGGWTVGGGGIGPVSRRLAGQLAALHRGTGPDRHGWLHPVER